MTSSRGQKPRRKSRGKLSSLKICISRSANKKWNVTGLKKKLINCHPKKRKSLLEPDHPDITLTRQAELLDISRSSIYYKPVVNQYDKKIMDLIDEIFTKCPFYGKRRICKELQRRGIDIGIKRTRTLMKKMGLEPIFQKPNTSIPHPDHIKYPYLLSGIDICQPNQVWSADITYIRMPQGWLYLTAILDWYSRFIIAWNLSITLEADFCIQTLEEGLRNHQHPDIFNSDQGVQFTSQEFISILKSNEIRISMDGRGRCFDNIFTERLWRTIKYEEVYLKDYQSVAEAHSSLRDYMNFYNYDRIHQALDYKTPAEIHFQKAL